MALLLSAPVRAQSFTADQRSEIEQIVKQYLLAHPELLQEVMAELEKNQAVADAEKHKAAVKENSAALFSSPRQVTLGNPQGDVTLVEFFDYNCGYCKRAMSDMLELLKTDGKLKFVLRSFRCWRRLGAGGAIAAPHAGQERRQEISRIPSQAAGWPRSGRPGARSRLPEVGFDVGRIEKDMTTPEVKTHSRKASSLPTPGLNGTPATLSAAKW